MGHLNERLDEDLDRLRRKALAALNAVVKGRNFEQWLTIGEYIETGRRWAMEISRSNQPKGIRYNQALQVWFARNPHFERDIGKDERNDLMRVMENLPAIRHFLDGESPSRRHQLNHPTSVLRAWKRKEASIENEAHKHRLEQEREAALKADDGTALGVPIIPSKERADPLTKGEPFTLDPDDAPNFQAMRIRKVASREWGEELTRQLAKLYGLKLVDESAPKPRQRAKVAEQQEPAQ